MKIKICGLFRDEDIDYVNEARPDYIGFVFAPSRRQVSPEKAARLRARLQEGIIPVGVFVRAPAEEIAALYRAGVIHIAQLHGEEDPAYIAGLKARCGIPVIQVIKSGPGAPEKSLAMEQADYVLFDGAVGGSGKPFDWNLLKKSPSCLKKPWFLAGGIDLETIDKALELRPYGVDISSGAERGGVKDRDKIIRLVKKIKNAPRIPVQPACEEPWN
ncbi:MAG: phosphoribosylanthranilate isomerase [Treponema sp.]|jgi:phosphoribosylanthranilate isomerase|nr:phosphoribosylanthranilate isomerase [Treponema sp.]